MATEVNGAGINSISLFSSALFNLLSARSLNPDVGTILEFSIIPPEELANSNCKALIIAITESPAESLIALSLPFEPADTSCFQTFEPRDSRGFRSFLCFFIRSSTSESDIKESAGSSTISAGSVALKERSRGFESFGAIKKPSSLPSSSTVCRSLLSVILSIRPSYSSKVGESKSQRRALHE